MTTNSKQQDFIRKAESVHGDTYDYSSVVYECSRTKVTVLCRKHGPFEIKPGHLTSGRGCQSCSKEKRKANTLKKAFAEFVIKSEKLHNSQYQYDHANYQGVSTPIAIICREHGEFMQTPSKHLMGRGCPECGRIKSKTVTMSTEVFVERAKKQHGDKYDYTKTVYVKAHEKLTITCRLHGDFIQNPHNHLSGAGCKKCADIAISDTKESFIKKAQKKHGEKYDYTGVDYSGNKSDVEIACPKHGKFDQTPSYHLQGFGCPSCANEQRGLMFRSSTEEFLRKAIEVHGDKWDYSKTEYVTSSEKLMITCPVHGDFLQVASSHLSGKGCETCGKEKSIASRTSNTDSFIEKAKVVHGDQYSYDNVEYKNSISKVVIHCSKHGDFWQTPSSHLIGSGCPKCGLDFSGKSLIINFDEFYERAFKKFGGKFTYDRQSYINISTRINIVCPRHGAFEQLPAAHLKSELGCPKCHRIDYEMFLERARDIHGDSYQYNFEPSAVDGGESRITITCPNHGEFEQTVSDHLSGTRCRQCYVDSTKLSQEAFIESCKSRHDNQYGYDSVVYKTIRDKIQIECFEHGYFEQTAHDHKHGAGCPQCAEYYRNLDNREPNTPCILYYLEMKHDNHLFYKIGITTVSVKHRYARLKLDNVSIEYVEELTTTLAKAIKAEQKILIEFNEHKLDMTDVLQVVRGGTECFADDVLGKYDMTLSDYLED